MRCVVDVLGNVQGEVGSTEGETQKVVQTLKQTLKGLTHQVEGGVHGHVPLRIVSVVCQGQLEFRDAIADAKDLLIAR